MRSCTHGISSGGVGRRTEMAAGCCVRGAVPREGRQGIQHIQGIGSPIGRVRTRWNLASAVLIGTGTHTLGSLLSIMVLVAEATNARPGGRMPASSHASAFRDAVTTGLRAAGSCRSVVHVSLPRKRRSSAPAASSPAKFN
jgi:hypothetical protein